MKKRVLIMSASAGSGHIRAAEALKERFEKDERVAEVRHEDSLKFGTKPYRDFYSKLYIKMVRSTPDVLGALYQMSDSPWRTDSVRIALDRLNTRPLVKFIDDFKPDITVCTHFMPAGIIAHLMENDLLETRLSIVVTDFDVHAMWLARTFHRYFVAIDEAKAYMETLGMPPERVTVSGIPISEEFLGEVDRAALRKAHGLDPDKTTLLVSAGTFGVGPAAQVVAQLRRLRHDAQIVVICGRSEELQGQIQAATQGDKRFHVQGYTTRMHEMMKLSDLFIGKPGGLTTAEALTCGLPMVIFAPIPGQEVRNSDHLLEDGVALKSNELATIAFKIDRLLDDPARLATMRAATRRLAHPHATRSIVDTLLTDDLPPLSIDREARRAMRDVVATTRG